MRVCVVYDCLFPHTVGGAERWYRNLAERLAAAGHEVSYLTLRQWDRGQRARLDGDVRVIVAGPRMSLYTSSGRRRILPPLVFGAGVLAHLLRHGRRYEIVHTASFPYFSLLAAGLLRPFGGFSLMVDWHEVWSRSYWREYLGPGPGAIGYLVQLLCAHLPQSAFCFSRLHAERLREEGLRGCFFGNGPEREAVLEAIESHGLEGVVEAPGFVPAERVDATLGSALCLLLPSRREGYGMVVVEAAARGTPSIVVAGDDNAATELVADGVNGFVVASPDADEIASAIVRVREAGMSLRQSTAAWFAENCRRLSLESSLSTVLERYGHPQAASSGRPPRAHAA